MAGQFGGAQASTFGAGLGGGTQFGAPMMGGMGGLGGAGGFNAGAASAGG